MKMHLHVITILKSTKGGFVNKFKSSLIKKWFKNDQDLKINADQKAKHIN